MLLGFTLGARTMVNKACQPANFRGPLYQKPLVCFHRWVEPVKQQILQRHKQLCFSSLGYTILSTTMNQNISKPQGSNPTGEDFFFSQSLCQKQSSVGLLITSNSGLRRHCIRLKMTFCFLQNMLGVLLLRIRSKKRSEENLGFQMAKKTLKYWVATEIVARTKCVFGYVPCFF